MITPSFVQSHLLKYNKLLSTDVTGTMCEFQSIGRPYEHIMTGERGVTLYHLSLRLCAGVRTCSAASLLIARASCSCSSSSPLV